MIVLDASVVVELLMGTPRGREVAARIARPRETWHAPHLLDIEVAQVLRRYRLAGTLSAQRAAEAIDDLVDLDVTRHSHDVLLRRVWSLAGNLTAYDAAYVALAEALDAPLLTADRRLASAPGNAATIELIP